MGDLEKVTGLVEDRLRAAADAERAQAQLLENNKTKIEKQKKSSKILAARLKQFAIELRKKAGIYIYHYPHETEIVVSIGSVTPIIRRPYCKISLSPAWDGEGYALRCRMYDKDEEYKGILPSDEVLDFLSVKSADFITAQSALNYELPYWYVAVGNFLSWPLFAIVWIFCVAVDGLPGFLWGWIPGILLKYVAKYFWLPAIVVIFFKLQGS